VEASITIAEAIEGNRLGEAGGVLGSLSAENQLTAYALVITDYFLANPLVSVEELKLLRALCRLVGSARPLGESPEAKLEALHRAHVKACKFLVDARESSGAPTFDEDLGLGGALLSAFRSILPEVPATFYEDSLEALATEMYLNCLDGSGRRQYADDTSRQRMVDWLDQELEQAFALSTKAGDDTAVAFADALDKLETEVPEIAFDLLKLSPASAFASLRLCFRRCFENAIERASTAHDRGEKQSVATRCTRLVEMAKVFLALVGPLDVDSAGAEKEDSQLASENLQALALGSLCRVACYGTWLKPFCRAALDGELDMDLSGGDAYTLHCLLSVNPYDAKDKNALALEWAMANKALEVAQEPGRPPPSEAECLAFQDRAVLLAAALGLGDDGQWPTASTKAIDQKFMQVKDRALEATSRMLGPRQQPGQLANAGLLLGLGRAAVDQAMGAEAAAGFRDQVELVLDTFVAAELRDDAALLAALQGLRAQLSSATGGGGQGGGQGGGTGSKAEEEQIRAAVGARVRAQVGGGLRAERAGDLVGAKRGFEAAAKLPKLVAEIANTGDSQAVIDEVASSLRDTLSEEEEVALSEICWELEDSGEPENEQIAAGLLRLLGMK